jgi:hypothetical protein
MYGLLLLLVSVLCRPCGFSSASGLFSAGRFIGVSHVYGIVVFVSSLYALAAVEDILGEAHESTTDTRWLAFRFLGGYTLFLLVSGMG